MANTKLVDLFTDSDLAAALDEGLVRQQFHPADPALRILNYTEQATYTRTWTPVTRQCRGLIHRDGVIVARPWPKFFNYGEHADGGLDLTAPVEVTDKQDGSLGILYQAPDGLAIATRGSFASEQARHATELFRRRYGHWTPLAGWTYLFEIVYPGNRIVLDYGDTDDLVLLGAVEIETGRAVGPTDQICLGWAEMGGPRTQVFGYATLADALAATPRPNAEGLVVRYLNPTGDVTHVKLKQDDYVALHRIITGMTARRLWERAAVWGVLAVEPDLPVARIAHALRMDPADVQVIIDAGPNWADEVRRTAPEEFTDWIDATLTGFMHEAQEIRHQLSGAVTLHRGRERKLVAQDIAKHQHRGLIFAALDGKPIEPGVWAAMRPAHEPPLWARGEDVA